jgi:hypothetical protein
MLGTPFKTPSPKKKKSAKTSTTKKKTKPFDKEKASAARVEARLNKTVDDSLIALYSALASLDVGTAERNDVDKQINDRLDELLGSGPDSLGPYKSDGLQKLQDLHKFIGTQTPKKYVSRRYKRVHNKVRIISKRSLVFVCVCACSMASLISLLLHYFLY